LFLVALDAGLLSLRAWPTNTFPGWLVDKVVETVADVVRARGEVLYGKEEWLERTIALESTVAFRMTLMLKLQMVSLASLTAALLELIVGFLRSGSKGKTPEGPARERGARSIPLSMLILGLLVAAPPFGAVAAFVCYLIADWQRRRVAVLRNRKFFLVGYQVACALIILVWDVAAQMPWGEGWSKMYPLLGRLLGAR
jgi:hypothetical protein